MGSCWCYETEFEFRSLMAREKLLQSLSVFAIMLRKRLPDGSKKKRWLPGWFESLIILQFCFCSVWGRWPAERGVDPEMRSAKRTLSAELCSPDLALLYHTEMHRVNTLSMAPNRKFSGLLVRPWISSAVADGTVFGWLYSPVFECVQSKSGPRRCLHRGTWSYSPSPQGSHWS